MIWGLGFVATRWTLIDYSPLWSNAIRYVFAAIVSLGYIVLTKNLKKTIYHKNVFICSLFLMSGMALQTIGIGTTTMAKSGFLTVLYAVFTPMFLMLKGVKLSTKYWLCVVLAMIGVAMMCELKIDGLNSGDLFIIGSAILFSMHIISVDILAKNQPPFLFNLWQCFYMGIIGFFATWALEPIPTFMPIFNDRSIDGPLAGFIFLVIFSSIIAFGIQIKVQEKLKPHIVSLIFLMESVFASLFGYLFFHETLSLLSMAGAFFILLSVFMISIISRKPQVYDFV